VHARVCACGIVRAGTTPSTAHRSAYSKADVTRSGCTMRGRGAVPQSKRLLHLHCWSSTHSPRNAGWTISGAPTRAAVNQNDQSRGRPQGTWGAPPFGATDEVTCYYSIRIQGGGRSSLASFSMGFCMFLAAAPQPFILRKLLLLWNRTVRSKFHNFPPLQNHESIPLFQRRYPSFSSRKVAARPVFRGCEGGVLRACMPSAWVGKCMSPWHIKKINKCKPRKVLCGLRERRFGPGFSMPHAEKT